MNDLNMYDFEKNLLKMVSEYVTAVLTLLLPLCCSDVFAVRVTW